MALIYKVKTIETLYNSMKNYLIGLGSVLTNFNVGSRNRTLLESISINEHQTQFDFNEAIKKAIPISVYQGFDFSRNAGVKASGNLNFTRITPAGVTYPIVAGTAVILDGIQYATLEDGEITLGNTSSGNITSQAIVVGTAGNIGINAINTLSGLGTFVSQPVGTEACNNPTSFTGGLNEETDEERQKRFRDYINSLARSTVLGLESGARTVTGVARAKAIENDPVAGIVSLYVDDGSGTLSPTLKAAVEKVIDGDPNDSENFPGYRAAGIQVNVQAPGVENVDVDVTIYILTTSIADPDTLKIQVQEKIEAYINTLNLGFDVIRSKIAEAALSANNEIYDIVITQPATNVSISNSQVAKVNVYTSDVATTIK